MLRKLILLLHWHLKDLVLALLILSKLRVVTSLTHHLHLTLGLNHLLLQQQITLILKLVMRKSCSRASLIEISLGLSTCPSIQRARHKIINHLRVCSGLYLLTLTAQILTLVTSHSAIIYLLSSKAHLLKARLNLLATLSILMPLDLLKTRCCFQVLAISKVLSL